MKLRRFDHLFKRPQERCCEQRGCARAGTFRAPRDRTRLRELHPAHLDQYLWFCEEHVRAYNLSWNYYAGMDDAEVGRAHYNDMFWQRPTVPFGDAVRRRAFAAKVSRFRAEDFFADGCYAPEEVDPDATFFPPHSIAAEALRVLDVHQPTTLGAVKQAYKAKAKQFHPDMNGGCIKAEETLKKINCAYQVLKKSF